MALYSQKKIGYILSKHVRKYFISLTYTVVHGLSALSGLVDNTFSLKVGLERTSVQKCLQSIYKSGRDLKHPFAFGIDALKWEEFYEMDKTRKYTIFCIIQKAKNMTLTSFREQMSTAMLLALAFNHLFTSNVMVTIPSLDELS